MPRTIALPPAGDLLYVCRCKSGSLGIVDTQRNRQVQQVATRTHPIGVTVSPNGRFIWVSSCSTSIIHWIERLRGISSDAMNASFYQLPESSITHASADFAKKLLEINRTRLLALNEELK